MMRCASYCDTFDVEAIGFIDNLHEEQEKNRGMKHNSKAFSVRNLEHEIAYILWRTTIFPRVKTYLVGRETSSYISVNLFTMWVKREVDLPICIQSLLMACHLEILKHSSVRDWDYMKLYGHDGLSTSVLGVSELSELLWYTLDEYLSLDVCFYF